MSVRATKTSIQGVDRADYLGESIRTNKTEVSDLLTSSFGVLPPRGEGEPPWPEWTTFQEANLELLDLVKRDAQLASQAHLDARQMVMEALTQRDLVVVDLKGRHRRLRASFDAVYSFRSLSLTGLEDPPVRRYLAVGEHCRFIVTRLRDPELPGKLGEPEADQAHLDLDKIATGLEKQLEVFDEAVDDVRQKRKLRDAALIAKQAAERRLNSVMANVARVQEGYFRLAGLEELADRIRLTIPKSRKKSAEDSVEGDPTSTDEPPADSSALG